MNERSVFLAALEIEDPEARRAFLDEACRDDASLRARIDELLAALHETRGFMNRPAAEASSFDPPTELHGAFPVPPEPPAGATGQLLAGRYLVGPEIGRGGMGTVYRAEQVAPVKRPVAVKLVNPGMDSRSVLLRFEAERQALAVMDHPNIAKVLDAGAAADGRPFFVMELVKGAPLTEYCDSKRLPVADRLELFRKVCSAVQHAHQKGVIHRDLKPSNVLVEERDGAASPKVIDFGLAKAVGGAALTEQTLDSSPGSVAGTPLYMAPEQAGAEARDVDTRADVYALGAMLYELLTGTPPIGRDTLRRAAWHEVLRAIREDEPPPPSSRIGSAADLPSVAANRDAEPVRLGRFVRGDLDWVVMKALEKDRSRRYDSAAAFGADLERFLNHEPVSAGPPTLRYRLGKFAARNRAAVTAASLIFLSLAAGTVAATLGMMEARRQRDAADKALHQAETNLDYARKGNAILGSVFEGLNPERITDRPLQDVLKENLATAARDLDAAGLGDPSAVAEMQQTLGVSLMGLGDYDAATALLEKAAADLAEKLGPDDRKTLVCRTALGEIHRTAGRLDKAVPLLDATLATMKAKLGPDDPDTLTCMNNLALAYRDAGRFAEAVALWEPALAARKAKLGPDDPATLLAMNSLANGYMDLGRFAEATSLWEQALAGRKAKLGPDHPHTLNTMDNLAGAYAAVGRRDEALKLWEETLRLTKARLGNDHPDSLVAMNNLAGTLRDANRPLEAVPIHEEALRLMRLKFGPDHPTTLQAMNNLAGDYWMALQFDKAEPIFEEVLALRKAKLGPDHPDVPGAMNNLATVYRDGGKIDKAIPLYQQVIPLLEKARGRDHPYTQSAIGNLGMAYLYTKRSAEAVPLLEETHAASRSNPTLAWAGPFLLDAYASTGKNDEAAKLIPEILAEARRANPKDSPTLSSRIAECSLMLLRIGKFAEAEPLLRENLDIRRRTQPDSWSTFNTMSQLGGALLGQKKYDEAEPLLVQGYEGLQQRREAIPPQAAERIPEALNRLIELYNATNRPDEAAKRQAERKP
ncbi:serine/threonine-protein kinase [Paludisphaera rhizosphaerae]|uniref:serine/threonine-protein kinase n=1 Tax=Paludisphaera rhizosphaerae TaxID=2711216 RepID=UPI0013EB0011|nr:serine/threonine-protein kinase [Paludisphaera rhizosphaerae]